MGRMLFEQPRGDAEPEASASSHTALARFLRWAACAIALASAVAGCGGGSNDQGLSGEAQVQRDQTAAVIQAQQSATQLMSALIQPGSGMESFESGMGDWQNWGNAQVVAGEGTSGSKAMQVGPAAGGAALQVPGVVGGTTYRLAAQVRVTDPANGPATLGVDFYDASGNRIIGTRAPSNITSTTLAAFSYDVSAPAGASYALVWVWKDGSTGLAYVDDVAFAPASAPPPPPPPPPPSDGNLVSNGGFEAGMSGWTDWGNTQVVAGQGNAGSAALSVGTAAGGAGYNVDGIAPGTSYRWAVSAKVSDASDKAFVGVNFLDAAGALVTSTQRSSTSTNYTTLGGDAIAPTGAVRAVVYVWKDAGSGVAYVDDFSFGVTSGSTPPPPTGPNLLQNGTFENGLANWVNWGNATTSSQAAAGTAAAQVGTGAGGLGESVTGIVPGNTYRVSAQVKVSSAEETGYLGLKFMDSAGNSLQDAVVPFSSTSYASAQVELIAPANATTALVYVWKNAGSGYAFLDQAELRGAAPPPAPSNVLQPGAFSPFGPAILVSNYPSLGDRGLVSAARLTSGGSVVAWSTGASVLVQRLDANGNTVDGAQTVGPVISGDSAVYTRLSAAATADGGWLIAWIAPDRSLSFRRFDASGAPVGAATLIDAASFSKALSIQAKGLADGFVVAWAAAEGTGPARAFARRFSAEGTPVTGRMAVTSSTSSQTFVQITPMTDGNFLAGWVQANADGTDSLLVRRLDAALNAAGPEQVLQPSPQFHPFTVLAAASLSNGTALFAWVYDDHGANVQVRWQLLDTTGALLLASPGSSESVPSRIMSSVEVIPAAGGFRVVAESTYSNYRENLAYTTVVDVGTAGERLGSTESSRALQWVSATTGAGCSGWPGRGPGVAAAGGEEGRYLLAYAMCPGSQGRVAPNLQAEGR